MKRDRMSGCSHFKFEWNQEGRNAHNYILNCVYSLATCKLTTLLMYITFSFRLTVKVVGNRLERVCSPEVQTELNGLPNRKYFGESRPSHSQMCHMEKRWKIYRRLESSIWLILKLSRKYGCNLFKNIKEPTPGCCSPTLILIAEKHEAFLIFTALRHQTNETHTHIHSGKKNTPKLCIEEEREGTKREKAANKRREKTIYLIVCLAMIIMRWLVQMLIDKIYYRKWKSQSLTNTIFIWLAFVLQGHFIPKSSTIQRSHRVFPKCDSISTVTGM